VTPSSQAVFDWLPCPVVFITSAHGGQKDIMTATAMFVSEKEPLLQISVAQSHLTEKLIQTSGRFTIVLAGEGQQTLAMQVGSVKGADIDKFTHFSISLDPSAPDNVLVPAGACAWMACQVESSQKIKSYRLFIGRVVDQAQGKTPPLIWHNNRFCTLLGVLKRESP
jgi:flavin reductase (DIM6/NTAB) family NADH-FMN oxidoreductase RutF